MPEGAPLRLRRAGSGTSLILCLSLGTSFHAQAFDSGIKGLTLGVSATTDFIGIVAGGVERGTATPAALGITAEVSTADIGAWKGGVFNTAIFGVTGTDPSLLSGDIQDASNIAAFGSVRVYEAWYEHSFDSGIQILTGLRDVNSDFYSLEHADTFINGSFGIGQEIAQDNLPTWAITSPGVRIKIPLSAETYVQTAVFDGIPGDPTNPYGTHVRFDRGDGILTLFEAGWVRTKSRYAKVAAGSWHNTAEFEDFANRTRDSDWGAYLVAEADFVRAAHGGEGLGGFVQFGYSAEDRNPVGYYAGVGAEWTGALRARPDDVLGLAVAHARTASGYLETFPGTEQAETVVELTYLMTPRPWLALQPDIQYALNPGVNPNLDDVIILGLRVGISF